MSGSARNGARARRVSARVRRRRRLFAFISSLVLVAVIVGVAISVAGLGRSTISADAASPAQEAPAPAQQAPEPAPPGAAQALLSTTDDPNACAVSFDGDGIADAPQLQSQGGRYAGLPIPQRDGAVFAGWYATRADAAAFTVAARVNGSKLVACTDREVTLYGSWMSPEQNAAEDAQIPILMYHQFTTRPEGEEGWLRGNYAYIGDFDAHMNHIATGGFYLPTWDEVSALTDGRLFLPTHSVVITDDDADQTWLDLAAPVVEKYELLTTSFVITEFRQDATPNQYVIQRSHTHAMHHPGADGDGRMTNSTADEIAADLEASATVLGAKEVVAYPFGHYNDIAKEGLVQAGFELGRTTEPGYVSIGTDKLALPVIRIDYGMGLDALVGLIG